MPPKKATRPRKSTFDSVIASIPQVAEFQIEMAADSTDEVWDDIDTDIGEGQAWIIYGGEYWFEGDDPSTPMLVGVVANSSWTLQIHRDTESELLLAGQNNHVMYHDIVNIHYSAAAAGTIEVPYAFPRKFGRPTVTFQENLRAIFRTTVDMSTISDADKQLCVNLYYDVITAPNVGQSKLGQLANL